MYPQIEEETAESGVAAEAAESVEPAEMAPTEAPIADEPAPVVGRRSSMLSSLQSEIARAMQVAAAQERQRIDAGVGEEETVQVEKILSRAAAEAVELAKHADQDVSLVNGWSKEQVKRIRAEADRRIEDRRARLELSLRQHGSLIGAEMESVHVAVEGYRSTLGAFFGRLADEQDPSAIARLAGDLPEPPDLDDVRAEARAEAMQALDEEPAETPDPPHDESGNGNGESAPERELVGVMDPDGMKQPAGLLNVEDESDAPSEAPESRGNVAVRLVRVFKSH